KKFIVIYVLIVILLRRKFVPYKGEKGKKPSG
ncbi:MAG: hypothetical protein QG610_366, partial [Euryarchaeota archaeon]|nr:hypothetical protein [Euryarchaeota archaeon]